MASTDNDTLEEAFSDRCDPCFCKSPHSLLIYNVLPLFQIILRPLYLPLTTVNDKSISLAFALAYVER